MGTKRNEADKQEKSHLADQFTRSLDRVGVESSYVACADLEEALREVVRLPAVGAPLSLEGVHHDLEITLHPTVAQLEAARTGVTAARLGVADYGSILIQTAPGEAEPISLFPGRHVAVLRASDIVPDMPTAFRRIAEAVRRERMSFVVATGPSATADMGALVRGAHGPSEVHVIILADR